MNEAQLKLPTKYIGTRGVSEYRASIAELVHDDDTVLEIGCEWGTTTALLAQRCREVIGTDISSEVITRARKMYPTLHFEVMDGFDVRAALRFGREFSKIYIDISGLSGNRSTLDTLALLQMYATVFRPQAIIVKSGALKHLAAHCIAWNTSAGEG